MTSTLTPEQAVDLLRMMLRMRRLEEQVIHFAEDYKGLIRGHFHVYIGQESAGAAACAALGPNDYVFTTHRNHGHVVARGGDPGRVLAEIIGRVDGYCKGRGGTFHVAAPDLGILHTSAIVGGCLPLAAGAAYAAKLKRTGQVSLVFFGDGAMEEGVFYETINIAQLWRVPVIFYMENNAVSPQERPGRGSPTSEHAATALSDVPRAFNLETYVLDGTDADAVYATVSELVAKARSGEGPYFIESRTTRWPGNYGSFPKLVAGDTDIAWTWAPETAPEATRRWSQESDPVLLYARRLLERGVLTRDRLEALDREVREEIARAAQFALNSPLPPPEAALEHAYA
ncbi:MAG TPA: thiamine pyrophosphate-dependent dehydrogenase E1 component subunit alpha [Chloroflexota bacterium]|nr:thiamine pyrophosphate-dependent dehydrogenase E1 component subunit alpha [Chloroflexota bacterium]